MTTLNERRFYVYAYLRADGTPYYIGKGCGRRAWKAGSHGRISIPRDPAFIQIVLSRLTEDQSFAAEKLLVDWFGRKDVGTGILRNQKCGGEGGQSLGPEVRAKMSAAHKGKPSHRKGKNLSADHREKIRAAMVGKPSPNKGATFSPKWRAALSAAAKMRGPLSLTKEERARQGISTRKTTAAQWGIDEDVYVALELRTRNALKAWMKRNPEGDWRAYLLRKGAKLPAAV